MAKRAATATVDVGLRVKESLRAKLERTAKDGGLSLNAEIVRRLERSFRESSDNLLRVIVMNTIETEPKYEQTQDARKFGLSVEMKKKIKARLAAYVDSIPEAAPSSLTPEEAEELWVMVQKKQAEIDARKKR